MRVRVRVPVRVRVRARRCSLGMYKCDNALNVCVHVCVRVCMHACMCAYMQARMHTPYTFHVMATSSDKGVQKMQAVEVLKAVRW